MELGQKIKQARQELGLSQRQLCDGKITRNMLSQIENGTARPSMDTLSYLAGRLGKSVSWFLEEHAVVSPNISLMEQARLAFIRGETRKALELLDAYRETDMLFEAERQLLVFLCCLEEGKAALSGRRIPYAGQVLARAEAVNCPYITEPLLLQLRLLQQQAGQTFDGSALAWDALLYARAVLAENPQSALQILAACADQSSPQWHLHMGEAFFSLEDYTQAKDHYLACEEAFPKETVPRLEACFRELKDYKSAYEYACKQR